MSTVPSPDSPMTPRMLIGALTVALAAFLGYFGYKLTVTPPAPVVPTPAPATKTLAQATDFTFQGLFLLPSSMGQQQTGFTLRPSTKTFFIISATSPDGAQWPVVEMSIPPTLYPTVAAAISAGGAGVNYPGYAHIVRYHGDLNQGGLVPNPGALNAMRGLSCDEPNQRLYFNWATYYNAQASNQNLWGYATFNASDTSNANAVTIPAKIAGLTTQRVWGVPKTQDYENCKGSMQPMPASLAPAMPGYNWLMCGYMLSTKQDQSWGPGLEAVAQPTDTAANGTQAATKVLSYWPQTVPGSGPGMQGSSNFPRDTKYDYIYSGTTTSTAPFYATVAPAGLFTQNDAFHHFIWLEGPNKWTVMHTGFLSHGHTWYGNATEWNGQPDPDNYMGIGIAVPSLWFPGQANTLAGGGNARGTNCEAASPHYWLSDPAQYILSAQGQRNQQIPSYADADLTSIGAPSIFGGTEQMGYDATNSLLYMLYPRANAGFPVVCVWKVTQ